MQLTIPQGALYLPASTSIGSSFGGFSCGRELNVMLAMLLLKPRAPNCVRLQLRLGWLSASKESVNLPRRGLP